MNLKKIIVYVLIAVILILIPWLTWNVFYHEERTVVPIENKIENLISTKEIGNKLTVVPSVNFSGANSGGFEPLRTSASSLEQFLFFVGDKDIYSAVTITYDDNNEPIIYGKTYWAYTDNQTGIVIIYHKGYFKVFSTIENYDNNNVSFVRRDWFIPGLWTIMSVWAELFVLVIARSIYKWKKR